MMKMMMKMKTIPADRVGDSECVSRERTLDLECDGDLVSHIQWQNGIKANRILLKNCLVQ